MTLEKVISTLEIELEVLTPESASPQTRTIKQDLLWRKAKEAGVYAQCQHALDLLRKIETSGEVKSGRL